MLKKIIIISLISIAFLSSCNKQEDKIVKKYYKVDVVTSSWNLQNNSSNFIWYTKWIKQVLLATKTPWRITLLNKNIWDKVFAGELIANLDSSEAKASFSSANNITDNLIGLKSSTAKAMDEQIKAMQAKIEQAKAWLKGTTSWLEDTKNITNSQLDTAETNLEQAKLQLDTAETNLEQTKNTLKAKEKSILWWAKTAIIQSVILYENVIDFSDKLLWITPLNEDFNDKFDEYLGKKDIKQLKLTESIFKETKIMYDDYKKYYENYIENKTPTKEELIKWLKKAEKVAEKEKTLLKEINTVIDNSIENIYFNSSMINDYKNQISTLWSNIENSLLSVSWEFTLWIKWSLQNIENFDSESEKALSLLEKQVSLAKAWVNTAEKSLEQYKAMWIWEVNNVSTQKEIAEKNLQEALAWLEALKAQKQATLKELDAKIAESKWWRLQAWVMINNWKLIAPFSGIIINKTAELWQIIDAGMPIYEIADTTKIKVIVWVDDDTQKQLIKWDEVLVKIENIKKDFIWKINNISKSKNPITKKYEIEIIVDNKDLKIPSWAMAKIKFNINTKWNNSSHPIIPNKAIISDFMVPWVYIIKDNKVQFKNIKILKMWENNSEVSWIDFWNIIVIEWQENLYDGETLKIK